MPNYVACDGCGARCSRDVGGEIVVKARITCTDCLEKQMRELCDRDLGRRIVLKGRVWTGVKIVLVMAVLGLMIWITVKGGRP